MTARPMAMQVPMGARVCRAEGSSEVASSRSWRSLMSIVMASIWKCVPRIPHTWKTWWLCPARKPEDPRETPPGCTQTQPRARRPSCTGGAASWRHVSKYLFCLTSKQRLLGLAALTDVVEVSWREPLRQVSGEDEAGEEGEGGVLVVQRDRGLGAAPHGTQVELSRRAAAGEKRRAKCYQTSHQLPLPCASCPPPPRAADPVTRSLQRTPRFDRRRKK